LIGTKPTISQQNFLEALRAISAADSVEELVNKARSLTAVSYGSYHPIPSVGSHDYDKLGRYWSIGFSEEIESYFHKKGTKSDPVMNFVLSNARPYWLSRLRSHKDLADGTSQHRINLALNYIGDGILAPLFGPNNKRGYVYLGFGKPSQFYDDVFLLQMHTLLQATHVRYCILVESLRSSIKLTQREGEVLELISFGKTNPEIGIILGISTSTVAGHVKRIFLKLNTKDRVTAALRAQSFSL